MRKVVVAINITVDGFCDHTAVIADDDLHNYYANFMTTIDIDLMGRKTYELMESYWPMVAREKVGSESEIRFAERIDEIQKIVVSKSLKQVNWDNTIILSQNIVETVRKLKLENGKNIAIGGISIISLLTANDLIDEFYFVIQPILLTSGKKLFDAIGTVNLELVDTKILSSGAIAAHYSVNREHQKT